MSKTIDKAPHEKSRTNTALDQDLLALINKHAGRTRIITRDPSGKRKILAALFGARTAPSHQVEIEDFGNPEDPLAREDRLHAERVKRHEAQRLEIEEAVDKALKKQKQELTGQTDVVTPVAPVHAPTDPSERWNKRSFTQALADLLGADDCALESDEVEPVIEKGSNRIFVRKGDQTVLINVSFPRKPKK